MKTCLCGGDLLRHDIYRYKRIPFVRIRYICKDCRETIWMLEEVSAMSGTGKIRFHAEGRPRIRDARFEGELKW
jgi:hypothetical protein